MHIRMTRTSQPQECVSLLTNRSTPCRAAGTGEPSRTRPALERQRGDAPRGEESSRSGRRDRRTRSTEAVDLIVISTHARITWPICIIGSTTLKVINDPPAPVLAIRYGIASARECSASLCRSISARPATPRPSWPRDRAAAGIGSASGDLCSDDERKAAESRLNEVAVRIGTAVKRAVIRSTTSRARSSGTR